MNHNLYTKQGLLNLDNPSWKNQLKKKETNQVHVPYEKEKEKITDLIYCYLLSHEKTKILEQFPDARFNHVYDTIREDRTEVNVTANQYDWYRHLIVTGMAELSLWFQLAVHQEPSIILAILKENKANG